MYMKKYISWETGLYTCVDHDSNGAYDDGCCDSYTHSCEPALSLLHNAVDLELDQFFSRRTGTPFSAHWVIRLVLIATVGSSRWIRCTQFQELIE